MGIIICYDWRVTYFNSKGCCIAVAWVQLLTNTVGYCISTWSSTCWYSYCSIGISTQAWWYIQPSKCYWVHTWVAIAIQAVVCQYAWRSASCESIGYCMGIIICYDWRTIYFDDTCFSYCISLRVFSYKGYCYYWCVAPVRWFYSCKIVSKRCCTTSIGNCSLTEPVVYCRIDIGSCTSYR